MNTSEQIHCDIILAIGELRRRGHPQASRTFEALAEAVFEEQVQELSRLVHAIQLRTALLGYCKTKPILLDVAHLLSTMRGSTFRRGPVS